MLTNCTSSSSDSPQWNRPVKDILPLRLEKNIFTPATLSGGAWSLTPNCVLVNCYVSISYNQTVITVRLHINSEYNYSTLSWGSIIQKKGGYIWNIFLLRESDKYLFCFLGCSKQKTVANRGNGWWKDLVVVFIVQSESKLVWFGLQFDLLSVALACWPGVYAMQSPENQS